MIRKSLGVMTGMVLIASVGAAGAAELGNKAQVPQILASLDRSGYGQLSEQEMAEVVGTQVPTELVEILSAAFDVTNLTSTTSSLTPSATFWPVQVTETASGWTATSADGRVLTITRSGSNLIITTPSSTESVTISTSSTSPGGAAATSAATTAVRQLIH